MSQSKNTRHVFGAIEVLKYTEFHNARLTGIASPIDALDATNKEYVDAKLVASNLHDGVGITVNTSNNTINVNPNQTQITGLGTIQVGTFPTTLNAGFKFLGSYNLDDTVYSATYQIQTVSSNITISSYDQTTQIIKGTLSGTALNKAGEIVTITNGKFEAKLH